VNDHEKIQHTFQNRAKFLDEEFLKRPKTTLDPTISVKVDSKLLLLKPPKLVESLKKIF
jgi:hypothetical protein